MDNTSWAWFVKINEMRRRKVRSGIVKWLAALAFALTVQREGFAALLVDMQARVDATATAGGGTVAVGPGTWETRPFVLKSNVTLDLKDGAVLQVTTNAADYAEMPRGQRYFIFAEGATNVAIVGRGVLDGCGEAFRESRRLAGESQPQDLPIMMRFSRCRDVRLRDFTFRRCGSWGCHLRNCDGVVVSNVTCFSHSSASTNDGIDIESSNVVVEDCTIDSGDDALVFKTESDKSFPVTNVVVRNCRFASRCNGIKFGTGSYCDVRDVRIENCRLFRASPHPGKPPRTVFPGVTEDHAGLAGIAVEVVDGGRLENVTFENLDIDGYMVPFFVRLGRRRAPLDPSRGTYLRNVRFEHIRATADSRIASSVTGVPGLRPKDIVFRDVRVTVPGGGTAEDAARPVPEMEKDYPECTMFHHGWPDDLVHAELTLPAWGFYVRHADAIRFEDVRLVTRSPEARRAYVTDDVRDVKIVRTLWPEGRTPEFQAEQAVPELRVALPEKRVSDALLMIAPGGSYQKWCEWESTCADWFNKKGLATAVLRYRTPRPEGLPKHQSAWQDAQRAVRIVRAQASEWGVDPEKIVFMGFSAGGNLTIRTAVSSQNSSYAKVDDVDDLPCHVNGAIACYPAYVLSDCEGYDGGNLRKGNPLDLTLDPTFAFDAKTPPMCFLHGDADAHSPMGSVRVYHKLRTMGVPAELHVFATRTHADLPRDLWKPLVWEWLRQMNFIPRDIK